MRSMRLGCSINLSCCSSVAVLSEAGEGRLHGASAGASRAAERAGASEGPALPRVSPSHQHALAGRLRDAPRRHAGQEEDQLPHAEPRRVTALLHHRPARRQVSVPTGKEHWSHFILAGLNSTPLPSTPYSTPKLKLCHYTLIH